jgi:hypothetical protein
VTALLNPEKNETTFRDRQSSPVQVKTQKGPALLQLVTPHGALNIRY